MNVTNNKLSSLIDVAFKYSGRLLSLLLYTGVALMSPQDKVADTHFLITIFIFLFDKSRIRWLL